MRTASTALKAFLASGNLAYRADLLTISLQNGTVFRWGTTDVPVSFGGNTFLPAGKSSAPGFKRSGFRNAAKLSIDQLDVTLSGGAYTINGLVLPAFARAGGFRGARVQIDHLIGSDLISALTLGGIVKLFEGPVGDTEPRLPSVVLHCNSQLISLQQLAPKFVLAPQCGNVVFDANCALSKAAFTVGGTVTGSLSKSTCGTSSAPVTSKGSNYFDLGVLRFTSGVNAGLARAVRNWSGSVFTFALPFPAAPANGDAFTVYPGCDRSRNACLIKFDNLDQYRGFPHIPTSEAGQ